MSEVMNAGLGTLVMLVLALWRTETVRKTVVSTVGEWAVGLPKWAQPFPPLSLALAAAALVGYSNGLRGEDLALAVLQSGGETTAWAIALWHTAKRWTSGSVTPPAPPATKPSTPSALKSAVLLAAGCAFLLAGCGSLFSNIPPNTTICVTVGMLGFEAEACGTNNEPIEDIRARAVRKVESKMAAARRSE